MNSYGMNQSDAVKRFVVGETVKVVGPFPDDLRYLTKYIGWYGRVQPSVVFDRVEVGFSPEGYGADFPPEALERGHIEWIPAGDEA